MNDLTIRQNQLPDDIKDLSKFVLVGREKLNSVRAEIKAIDKLNLAREVRDQKRDEARMMSEALLDAEVKLGDLFKDIPKESGKRTDIKPTDSAVGRLGKTKKETISDLGFSEKQAERFETLADNKDVVEFVKAEARENDDIPTRTRVLDMVQYQKKKEEVAYDKYMDGDKKYRELDKILRQIDKLEFTDEDCDALVYWNKDFGAVFTIDDTLKDISRAVKKLNNIHINLLKTKGNNNGTKRY